MTNYNILYCCENSQENPRDLSYSYAILRSIIMI